MPDFILLSFDEVYIFLPLPFDKQFQHHTFFRKNCHCGICTLRLILCISRAAASRDSCSVMQKLLRKYHSEKNIPFSFQTHMKKVMIRFSRR